MRLVQFTGTDGRKVYINPRAIIRICKPLEGESSVRTIIEFIGGTQGIVEEIDDVVQEISYEGRYESTGL